MQSKRKLSVRDRQILRDVIVAYLSSGEPVSSRCLSKQEHQELSAATIRNVMADLAELGYLQQPHTSAGRVPTSSGYHLFIDDLMDSEEVPQAVRNLIDETLAESDGAEEVVENASQLLSRLSNRVGLVLTPAMGNAVLKAIEFAPLTDNKVLCITGVEYRVHRQQGDRDG